MQAFLGHPAPPDPGARPSASDAHPSLKRLYIGVAPERTSTQRARSFSVTSGGSSSNLARSRAVSFSATAKDGSEKVTPPGRSRSSTVSSSRRGRGGAVGANEALLWDSATYEIGAGYRPKRPDDSLQVPIRPSLAPLAPVDAPIPPQTVEPPTTAQSEQAQVPSAKPRLEQMRPSDLPANQLRRKTVQFGELVEGHAHAHVAENGVAHDAVGDVKTDPPTASTSESRPPATESDRGTLPSSIIRVDRMLAKIQWIPRQGLPRFYDEKASRRYDPVDDPFEEFAVVLRKGSIGLYRDRRALVKHLVPSSEKKMGDEIVLDRGRTNLSVYSVADATFCVTVTMGERAAAASNLQGKPTRRTSTLGSTIDLAKDKPHQKRAMLHIRTPGTAIYIFRARSIKIAGEWLFEIYRELGGEVPRVIPIRAQDLSATVRMPLWGEKESDAHCKSPVQVIEEAVRQLRTVKNYKDLQQNLVARGVSLGLNWKRDGILEWITDESSGKSDPDQPWSAVTRGFAMQSPRNPPILELRPALHYPTAVKLEEGIVNEPPGIEGFATRVRAGKANERYYLASHDGLVFLTRAKDAVPPPPPLAHGAEPGLVHFGQSVFSRNPSESLLRRLNETPGDPESPTTFDTAAHSIGRKDSPWHRFLQADLERQRSMIRKAVGCIDLRQVRSIDSMVDDNGPSGSTDVQDEEADPRIGQKDAATQRRRPAFELQMSNGKRVRLETATADMAKEWASRLPVLQRYWKKRWETDVQMRMVAQVGGDQASSGVSVTEMEHTTGRMLSSLYNWCILSDCRTITRVGYLSKKKEPTQRWKLRMVVLAGHHLVEHLVFERSPLGKPKHYAFHRARFSLSLSDCYVFSGELCEQVLERGVRRSERTKDPDDPSDGAKPKRSLKSLVPWSSKDSGEERDLSRHEIRRKAQQRPKSIVQKRHGPAWDPDHAELAFLGANANAKVYADGLRAAAGQADCCFVVWQKQGPTLELGDQHRMRIYRARSKIERDEWLFAINALLNTIHDRNSDRERALRDFKTP